MAGLKGDFIGFSFNGKHSSDMGITRVSDGNRYNDNILPTMQDKTATVPGADGTYFFKTNYTQKTFNINFAFDSLTESEYRGLRQWLGDKKPHDLIFDEVPYKVYKAKVTGNATIKTICFDEENENVDINKRNLVPINLLTEQSQGITYTDNKNGTVSVSGAFDTSATNNSWCRVQKQLIKFSPGKYRISGCPSGGGYNTYRLLIRSDSDEENVLAYDFGEGAEFSVNAPVNDAVVYIFIKKGTEIDGTLTFVPRVYSINERVYKGEGNIQFTAYTPFARSQFKTKEEYINYTNSGEWLESSGIKTAEEIIGYDTYLDTNNSNFGFKIYNPGDIATDYTIIIPFQNSKILAGKIYLENTAAENQLAWNEITPLGKLDKHIQINSKLNLIEGLDENKQRTGTVYNGFIKEGHFFKIPVTDSDGEMLYLFGENGNYYTGKPMIRYDYLYF